jgi:hypothetical protein
VLTNARSTQSPRAGYAVPDLCKHAVAEASEKEQDESPWSADCAAAVAPPTLPHCPATSQHVASTVSEAGVRSALDSTNTTQFTAAQNPGKVPDASAQPQNGTCMHSSLSLRGQGASEGPSEREGQKYTTATCAVADLSSSQSPSEDEKCGRPGTASAVCTEPVATAAVAASSGMQTALGRGAPESGVPVAVCTRGCGVAGDLSSENDDDDDLLFAVNLTNVSAAPAAAANGVPTLNPLSSDRAAACNLQGVTSTIVPPQPQLLAVHASAAGVEAECRRAELGGYSAAADAVVPQHRLKDDGERNTVKEMVAWGGHAQRMTLAQQRQADRHVVQQVGALTTKHAAHSLPWHGN